jgi:hypothetical protein
VEVRFLRASEGEDATKKLGKGEGAAQRKVYKDICGEVGGEEKMWEKEEVLERYEGREQRDFLSMSRGEWLEFVEAVEGVALSPPPDWTRVEVFLAHRGLFVFLDLEYLKYAAPNLFRKKRLYEVAIDIAEKVAGMEVLAAVQPETFGQGGEAYAWPPREEKKLLEELAKCELFEELAIVMLREYGPCILVEADDHTDYALLAARPRDRKQP